MYNPAAFGLGGGYMTGLRLTREALVLLVGAWASPAVAQIATGTVTGTVKDVQGGVLPGATVTLVNDEQRTRSVPVVTNQDGAFVIANVDPGSYTLEVEMPAFKTLKRSGVTVSPGSPVPLGTLTLDVGGAGEAVTVHGETPLIQSSTWDRCFTVSPQDV